MYEVTLKLPASEDELIGAKQDLIAKWPTDKPYDITYNYKYSLDNNGYFLHITISEPAYMDSVGAY